MLLLRTFLEESGAVRSFGSRGTCYISGAKEENAIDSGAPLF